VTGAEPVAAGAKQAVKAAGYRTANFGKSRSNRRSRNWPVTRPDWSSRARLGSLRHRDIDLYLVRVMWPVRQVLRRSGADGRTRREPLVAQHLPRRARSPARALKHVQASGGIAGTKNASGEELLGEEAAEEHIAARSPGPDRPEAHQPEST
jgi:hypothetical protein